MKKYITHPLGLIILLVLFWTSTSRSQTVITTIQDFSSCPGQVIVPLHVENADSLGSISLIILYDTLVLQYISYQNVNPALSSSGMVMINKPPNLPSVNIAWFSLTPQNLGTGTIVELKFNYSGDSNTVISWDPTCQYSNGLGNTLPATFVDGTLTHLFIAPERWFPLDSTTFIGINPLLSWDASGCQAKYDLAFSTDSSFTTNTTVAGNLNSLSWMPGPLNYSTTYFWRIRATSANDTLPWSPTWRFKTKSPDAIEDIQPDPFVASVYPNPFSLRTTLFVDLNEAGELDIRISDIYGRLVLQIPCERMGSGSYKFPVNTANLSSGLYLCCIRMKQGSGISEKNIKLQLTNP